MNQLAQRRVNPGATRQSFAALPGPVPPPRGAMPPNHGLWLDEQQRRTPVGPHSCEQRPETPIPSAEPGACAAPLVDRELLPQGEVLEEQGRPRPERASEAANQQRDIKHQRRSTKVTLSSAAPELTGAWIEFCSPTASPPTADRRPPTADRRPPTLM